MNPFQKNPFASGSSAKIVGYNKQFDEKQKLSDIRESMAKLKFKPAVLKEESKVLDVKQKVDVLKKINRD